MHFSSKLYDEDDDYDVIECTKFDNNILVYKEKLYKVKHYVIKLKENQCAILCEKGIIFDAIFDKGIYSINFQETNKNYLSDFNDSIIKNNDDDLCIVFFNMSVITDNKFHTRRTPKTKFAINGSYEFQIEKPVKFFNEVIVVRTFYTREELVERIRGKISKIIKQVIKNTNNEYIFNEDLLSHVADVFDEYGIKIVSLNINDIELKKL